jgi:uncharacterized protein (TIGR02466 family)
MQNQIICETFFPELAVWYTDLNNVDNNSIKQYALDLEKTNSGRIISNRGGWQSNDIVVEDLPDCMLDLYKKLQETLDKITYEFDIKISIKQSWININRKNNYNDMHIHPGSILSGCYYVNDHATPIIFSRPPAQEYLYNSLKIDSSSENLFYNRIMYNCLKSRVLFFPSWVSHRVEPLNSDEVRISIAFNAFK